MKVFISHKDSDSYWASQIKAHLAKLRIDAYLDLLDQSTLSSGEELTNHIKQQLNSCTDIMIVVSDATKYSWWVPFEIGLSAQMNMPTASFVNRPVELPSFLTYWPQLHSMEDITKYVGVRLQVRAEVDAQYRYSRFDSMAARRRVETPLFYQKLKQRL